MISTTLHERNKIMTDKEEVTCQHCHGYGNLVKGSGPASNRHFRVVKCPVCQGKGTVRQ